MRIKKGFTLIEMLVVIAIIAVLVSIVIPTVTAATVKADAAVDAANLRSVLGQLNALIAISGHTIEEGVMSIDPPASRCFPGSIMTILYTNPGFIEVYYVSGTDYYGLDYLAEMAQTGSSTVSTAQSSTPGTWYIAGVGPVT